MRTLLESNDAQYLRNVACLPWSHTWGGLPLRRTGRASQRARGNERGAAQEKAITQSVSVENLLQIPSLFSSSHNLCHSRSGTTGGGRDVACPSPAPLLPCPCPCPVVNLRTRYHSVTRVVPPVVLCTQGGHHDTTQAFHTRCGCVHQGNLVLAGLELGTTWAMAFLRSMDNSP